MHATTQTTRSLVRQFVQFAPEWLIVFGAFLLVLASCFPWMRLFDFPVTPTSAVVTGAGGLHQEPVWFGLSILALFLALFRVGYRHWVLSAITVIFTVKLWFVYQALAAWFSLNEIEATRTAAERAPFATYGVGWYCLIGGCGMLIVSLGVVAWRES